MILVRQEGDHSWIIEEELLIGGVLVPEGAETDLASIPRPMTWLLPRSSVWNAAAVGHDQLWRVEVPAGRKTYRQADRWLREQLQALDVAFWRRWVVWAGVRLGAIAQGPDARREVLADLPRILGIAAIAGPVVLPTSAVVLAGLGAFWLLERATWLVGWRLRRRRANRPDLLVR